MLFTVYRTTNKVNGKYYFGVHKTNDPMDEYLGSGRYIKYAIAKHGAENFVKEILLSSPSPESAFALEFELIEKHRGNPLCYNLRQGGSGGFDYINRVGLNGNKFMTEESVKRRQQAKRKRFETDLVYRQKVLDNIHRIRLMPDPKVREQSRLKAVAKWRGGKHTDQTRKRMSEHAKGNKARLGIKWIHCGTEIKCVAVAELDDWFKDGWCPGRKDLPLKSIKRKTKAETAPAGMHWCSTHQDYLPVASFHADKNSPGGLKKHCIECRKRKREGKKW